MDLAEADKLVKELAEGFEALQDEYQKLHGRHQALERKLATAREQYNELVKLCGSGAVSTPPLSLASSPAQQSGRQADKTSLADILERNTSATSKDVANKVRVASKAANLLQPGLPITKDLPDGVKIWSGPSADRSEAAASKMMPSISESPLEQDFTVEGKPSKLGCPFASMAGKKLSSHAASVLSRYNHGSPGGAGSVSMSSVSRVNGKESFAKKSERRSSFVDPIKAEICGLSDHDPNQNEEAPPPPTHLDTKPSPDDGEKQPVEEAGVCPIRFLDQHSPEEVATYFERHKHELPRSHENCVKRYQSNEQQIRELDAKYGTLVSMIQGLGAKHKDFLPREPDEVEAEANGAEGNDDEKIKKWARSVSARAHDGREGLEEEEEERQPHFERPLRDIRVGESPSRPWGIHVPPEYLGRQDAVESSLPAPLVSQEGKAEKEEADTGAPKCPFSSLQKKHVPATEEAKRSPPVQERPKATFIAADALPTATGNTHEAFALPGNQLNDKTGRMVFTGPVFIGYNAQDAARILQESGLMTKLNE